jgi:hypothetical protein
MSYPQRCRNVSLVDTKKKKKKKKKKKTVRSHTCPRILEEATTYLYTVYISHLILPSHPSVSGRVKQRLLPPFPPCCIRPLCVDVYNTLKASVHEGMRVEIPPSSRSPFTHFKSTKIYVTVKYYRPTLQFAPPLLLL